MSAGKPASFVTAFAMALLLLAGCGGSNNSTDEVSGKGLIRAVHAVPELGPVDFLIEETLLGSIDYKGSTGISEYDDLSYTFNFDIWLPDDTEATRLTSLETSVVADTEYTYILAGTLEEPEIILWEQFSRDWDSLLEEAAANETEVTILDVAFGHVASDLGAVDVYLARAGVAPNPDTLRASLEYGEFQESVELDDGEWQLVVTDRGLTSPYLFASQVFTLTGATDVSIVLMNGDDSHTRPFSVRLFGTGIDTELLEMSATATLSAVHAANNTDALDIIAGDEFADPLFSGLEFGTHSGEVSMQPDEINLNITPAGNPGSFLAEETVQLSDSQRYTLYLSGLPGQLDGVLATAGSRRLATHAKFRYYQGAARFSAVDLYVVPAASDISLLSPLLSSVPYTGMSGYLSLEPDMYDIVLTWPGTKTVVAGPLRVDLAARGVYETISADSQQTDVVQLLYFEID